MVSSPPLPAGLPLEAADWEHPPLVVRQVVVQLAELIQQQQTTIQHLEARIQTLETRIAELEARVQQRSHHADRPPPSDPPYEQRPPRASPQGKPDAKPGHPGHQQALLAPTEVIEVKPAACVGGQTTCLDTSPYYTHQVIERCEIPMIVRHVVWYEASCPRCGRITKAQVPPEALYGYGPRLTALIGERSGSQRDRRSLVQEFCQSVLGVHLSRGVIQRAVERGSEAIKPPYEAIATPARRAPVNSIDETAWYQHGVLAWLWVRVNTTVACFMVHASRSTAAFEALIGRWAGILVSDG